MDRAFMESYFDMAYEDLQGVLMCENEDLKNAQEAFSSSIHQLFDSLPENCKFRAVSHTCTDI